MSDSWKDRQKAQEDAYFEKQNKIALEKLKSKNRAVRNSPVSGEPMEQIVMDGVTIDRCAQSGGIWLDAGELEMILKNHLDARKDRPSWLGDFLTKIVNR